MHALLGYITILKTKKMKSHHLKIAAVNLFGKYPSRATPLDIQYTVVGLGIRQTWVGLPVST